MKKTEKALIANLTRIAEHTNTVLETLSDPDTDYLTLYDCYRMLNNLNAIHERTDNAVDELKKLTKKILKDVGA